MKEGNDKVQDTSVKMQEMSVKLDHQLFLMKWVLAVVSVWVVAMVAALVTSML